MDNMKEIILFRIPTKELLDELQYRIIHNYPYELESFTTEELLTHILNKRMNSFRY